LPVACDVPVYAAQSLAEDEYVAFNACTHTELIRMPYSDFERLVNPFVAHFSAKKVSFDKQDERFG
jgi:Ala-tRNA(Pro) deacylase